MPAPATPDLAVEKFLGSLPQDLGTVLAGEFEDLAEISARWNPNGQISVAVVLPDGSLYGMNEEVSRISASAVKPLWTAAALQGAGVEAVRPLAFDVLVMSDNSAGGRMIDLAGGVDAVNAWTWEVAELDDTRLEAWRFEDPGRVADDFRPDNPMGNRTTVADLARFYARLYRAELLGPDESSALMGWLRDTSHTLISPGDLDGALLDRLPPEVAASALHKAGWLKPNCCRADYRQMIDAGLVVLPGGGWFALAIVTSRGYYYDLSIQWVSLAGCRIYAVLAGDHELACDRDQDGIHDPEIWN
ncbi:serine hydrolase [Candidatus Poriferisocius sp.]|uniref:serine hydrolase n=1 Tax=Candidatus Poriferisocius sp. TaxID=3101276 RepID=UPI003B01C5B5